MKNIFRFLVVLVMVFVLPEVISASYNSFFAKKDIVIHGVQGNGIQADLIIFEGTMSESWTSSGGVLNVVMRAGSKFIVGTGNRHARSIKFDGPKSYCGNNVMPSMSRIILDVDEANEGVYSISPGSETCSADANMLESVVEQLEVVQDEVLSEGEDLEWEVVDEPVIEEEVVEPIVNEVGEAGVEDVVEDDVLEDVVGELIIEESVVDHVEVAEVVEEILPEIVPEIINEVAGDERSVFDKDPESKKVQEELLEVGGFVDLPETKNEIGMMLSEGINAKTEVFFKKILQESADIVVKSGHDLDLIIEHNGVVKDIEAQKKSMDKYAYPLVEGDFGLNIHNIYALNNFIVYGTKSTGQLGRGERASLIYSFKRAYGKVPVTQYDWENVIRIANGAWVSKTNNRAERIAKNEFIRIYMRKPDMLFPSDKAAVVIMAYGLRPQGRDLLAELQAANVFRMVFKKNPLDNYDWDIVRGIAYSGARTDAYIAKAPVEAGEKVATVSPEPENIVEIDGDEINRITIESVGLCKSYYQFTSHLKDGAVSAEVRALQELLQCLGYFPATLKSTAIFGEITRQAVMAFQEVNGIDPLGVVGPKTRDILNQVK